DGEEAFDQRGAFFRPDLGKLDLHTAECTKPSPGQLRQIPGLLRSYAFQFQLLIPPGLLTNQ
ncbi:MAG TPA: hypothetical protein VFA18_01705, partial [Gemmataceae bacterium]|nr:hypothetical protein [Gemmataceae bacterium]